MSSRRGISQRQATLDSVSANTSTWVSSMTRQSVSTEWTSTAACESIFVKLFYEVD